MFLQSCIWITLLLSDALLINTLSSLLRIALIAIFPIRPFSVFLLQNSYLLVSQKSYLRRLGHQTQCSNLCSSTFERIVTTSSRNRAPRFRFDQAQVRWRKFYQSAIRWHKIFQKASLKLRQLCLSPPSPCHIVEIQKLHPSRYKLTSLHFKLWPIQLHTVSTINYSSYISHIHHQIKRLHIFTRYTHLLRASWIVGKSTILHIISSFRMIPYTADIFHLLWITHSLSHLQLCYVIFTNRTSFSIN